MTADKYTLKTILCLALPTMLEQLMQTAVQYIDTAMVSSLGTTATAAVGSTTTISWLVGSTVSAIGVGFLAYISQALGRKDCASARKASAQAVLTAVVAGIFLTALLLLLSGKIPLWMSVDKSIRNAASLYFAILYTPMLFRSLNIILGTVLRAAGDTAAPMRVGLAVNMINIVLNFILIYPTRRLGIFVIPGADLGINGAAAASAAAYTFGGTATTLILLKHKTVSPKGFSLKPDISVLKGCFRVAFPNMLQRFATSFGYVAFASMINSLGRSVTAAHTIANTVESAFYIPGWGMQTAAATLSGNACGAGDKNKLKKLTGTIFPLEIGLMAISGGLLFIFAPKLMLLFSHDSRVIYLGTTVLRMVAVSEPFYGVPIVTEGILQGMGRTISPFIYNVAGMWCVRIAGTYIFTKYLGGSLISAWGCMIAHNIFLFALFSVHFMILAKKELK